MFVRIFLLKVKVKILFEKKKLILFSIWINKQVQRPQIVEDIEPVSRLNTQIHLDYPNHRNAYIYYTLNGSVPTRHDHNVHVNNNKRKKTFIFF